MKKAENCWCPSYNDAARVLGLSLPIKLGRFTTDGFGDYFWYTEGKYSPKFMPLFRSTDMNEFHYYATSGQPYELEAIELGSYFPDKTGKIYFYNTQDLSIYCMATFLSIKSVAIWANAYDLTIAHIALVKLVSDDSIDEKCAWLLHDISSDDSQTVMLPVFAEDYESIFSKEGSKENIEVMCNGDTLIHGDDLYKIGLNPQEGFALEKQKIDFDFNSLFKP